MNVVSVDPAARRIAYAVFHEGVLVSCGYATSGKNIPIDEHTDYVWVLEQPRKYDRFSVAHKDLDRLNEQLKVCQRIAHERYEDHVRVRPSEWKGNVPKHIHHKRLLKVMAREEKALLNDRPNADMDYDDDVYDAVGIGLTHLERVGRGGTLPKNNK